MNRPPAFVFRDNPSALATARELGRDGVDVTVIDSEAGPAACSRYARFLRAPSYYQAPSEWAAFVTDAAAATGARPVLFPTEDAALLVADRFHAALAPHVRFSYAAPGPAVAVVDKRTLYRAAAGSGVATPRFVEAEPGKEPALPAGDHDWIAKPVCRYWLSEDSKAGARVLTFLGASGGAKALEDDPITAARLLGAAGFPMLLQERIPGPIERLVSIGLAIAPDGKLVGSFCARKRCEYPEPFGDGVIIETIESMPDLVERSAEVLRALGYWGICDVELKLDERDGAYKLLDANPRVWFWVGLGARAGVSLAATAYRLAIGEPCAPSKPAATGVRWVSPRVAAAFLLRTYRPGRHGWRLPLRVATSAAGTALADLGDYRDPIYAKPAAWSAAWRSLRRGLARGRA